MTAYIPAHPGGIKKIMAGSGKECSKIFHKFHLDLKIKNTPLRNMAIGLLVDTVEEQTWTGDEVKQQAEFLGVF